MGPIRTQKHSHRSSASKQPHYKQKSKPTSNRTNSDPNAISGVQKIKAAIRQARRLLAKDRLNADVRVQTERKLKSLEADLTKAEESRKEKTLATRYHKVKFFERQKVCRKIKQLKRKVSEATKDSSENQLQSELFDLRVDLNYILHYPKTKKYISLFPPEVRQGQEIMADDPDSATTNAEREETRNWIREQMEKRHLPNEPELTLQQDGTTPKGAVKSQVKWDKHNPPKKVEEAEESSSDSGIGEKDDFFEDDADDHNKDS
ncbi:hypothetical protein L218DRAFT_973478 [Marasmius fiardii PR-910]|nr:hypothetical protein L218DRAFT_973478 [Marasmius fiardii PR-910]